MEEDGNPHPQALAGLGIWAAQTVALLVAELHAQGAVDSDFVDQLASRLGQYDGEAPAGAQDAYAHVRYCLSGKWRGEG